MGPSTLRRFPPHQPVAGFLCFSGTILMQRDAGRGRELHCHLRGQQATNGPFPSCQALSTYPVISNNPTEPVLLIHTHLTGEENGLREVR